MKKNLTFLHTSPVHISTFDQLMAKLAPDVPVQHIVDENLLKEARTSGVFSDDLRKRVRAIFVNAVNQGAKVFICTCSTLGQIIDSFSQDSGTAIIRIDRPMAAKAVSIGSKIVIFAALESALSLTTTLVQESATRLGKRVTITEILCKEAWPKFEAGDFSGYVDTIESEIKKSKHLGDVLVLAQASMADAALHCNHLNIPVLSSPQLCVESALDAYRM